jgi:hypothetical protein
MLVRIVKQPKISSIDGIHIGYLVVGVRYDLGSTLASVLIAEGWAEPVDDASGDDRRVPWNPPRQIAADTSPRMQRRARSPSK